MCMCDGLKPNSAMYSDTDVIINLAIAEASTQLIIKFLISDTESVSINFGK